MKHFNLMALIMAMFMAVSVPTYTAFAQEDGAVAEETVENSSAAEAEDAEASMPDLSDPVEDGEIQPPESSDWQALLAALGGVKGMGTLGIIGLIVQMLMLLLRSSVGSFVGKWRLVAVYALSLVGGVVGLMVQDVSFVAALLHSNTLAAAQVLGHQAYKQFVVKKNEKS